MILFLIITALTVSIDSFVCGLSLSMSYGRKLSFIIGIALTVFLMCLAVNYATTFFIDKLTEKTACFSGLILIAIGIINLFKKEKRVNNKKPLSQAIITGFAVGVDGALANLSLALMGVNAFYVPITIAVCHALMIAFGAILSQTFLVKKLAKIEFLPSLILIILGAYKLLGLFI